MDDDDSRMSRGITSEGKKTEPVTVRLSDSRKQFIDARWKQEGMESSSEYMRHLVEKDYLQAASDFKLLADALGVKVSSVNSVDREFESRIQRYWRRLFLPHHLRWWLFSSAHWSISSAATFRDSAMSKLSMIAALALAALPGMAPMANFSPLSVVAPQSAKKTAKERSGKLSDADREAIGKAQAKRARKMAANVARARGE